MATWSQLCDLVHLCRARGQFADGTLLAQFKEYPAIHKAGVALRLWRPWEIPTLEGLDAIGKMLSKSLNIDPQNAGLSIVATFLEEQVALQAARTAPLPSPATREGDWSGVSGRPEEDSAPSGEQREGTAKQKRKGGKRPLEESNPLKFQVYQRIQQAHLAGRDHVDTVTLLKADKDFMEQVKQASEKLDTKLVKKALALFDQRKRDQARKNQESHPA